MECDRYMSNMPTGHLTNAIKVVKIQFSAANVIKFKSKIKNFHLKSRKMRL